jgi:hypothetical protein
MNHIVIWKGSGGWYYTVCPLNDPRGWADADYYGPFDDYNDTARYAAEELADAAITKATGEESA